jgi:hypothetical protein
MDNKVSPIQLVLKNDSDFFKMASIFDSKSELDICSSQTGDDYQKNKIDFFNNYEKFDVSLVRLQALSLKDEAESISDFKQIIIEVCNNNDSSIIKVSDYYSDNQCQKMIVSLGEVQEKLFSFYKDSIIHINIPSKTTYIITLFPLHGYSYFSGILANKSLSNK